MNILFFSHISNFSKLNKYPGGGWIKSLLYNLILHNHKVGLVSFAEDYMFNYESNGLILYSLKSKKTNKFKRLLFNLGHEIFEAKYVDEYENIVKDFKPDIIQVFGTESEHAIHLKNFIYNIPIVIHIQGLVNPCLLKWYNSNINSVDVLLNCDILKTIRGSGLFHDYYRFKKMAKMELEILKHNKYYLGRTQWDKDLISVLSKSSCYFHCDEILRNSFYNNSWSYTEFDGKYVLTSIFNENIYKGLDTIFDTVNVLDAIGVDYVWNIIGVDNESDLIKIFKHRIINRNSLKKIVFHGILSEESLIEILLKTSFYIHTSHIDNSPNSICEAMLLGVPVISTNVGGISSIVKHDENGFLIAEGDSYSIIYYILKYSNQNLMNKISENARLIGIERNDPHRIVLELISIYKKIIQPQ